LASSETGFENEKYAFLPLGVSNLRSVRLYCALQQMQPCMNGRSNFERRSALGSFVRIPGYAALDTCFWNCMFVPGRGGL